ncbi:helix-turn-helix domain-containing protein [Wenyingzhuangia sp. IMCC45574]
MPRTIFDNIVIHHFEKANAFEFCQYTAIRFFEILYIEEGKGTLTINQNKVPYQEKQLFIFIPNDEYMFDVETPTSVCAIKFIRSLFINHNLDDLQSQRKEWFQQIETILHSRNRVSNIQFQSNKDESSILSLFNVLCNEYLDSELKSETILKATLHSILHIISRNAKYTALKTSSSKIQDIINYIHNNIHNSSLLSKHVIAEEFNMSENYVGEYFKKQAGVPLKKYILNYKLQLVETRLRYSDLTFSEIASELGFTDSSHLDKTFSSYKGMSLREFKSHQVQEI